LTSPTSLEMSPGPRMILEDY